MDPIESFQMQHSFLCDVVVLSF